ncbi:MAG TPA: hypothetical protein VH165_34545, partial [Kofleriaceae bacterium]|nr:hypothetical protein [Kofleriaceae bacterium]
MSAGDENALEDANGSPWELSFSAVELGGSAALGADVRLDLAPHVTVLVGKNGAGKSLLLEKLQAGIAAASGLSQGLDRARFACEVDARERAEQPSTKLLYECRFQLRDAASVEARAAEGMQVGSEPDLKVEETCRVKDPHEPHEALLWRVDDGLVTYNTGERAEIATGRTLVNWTIGRRHKLGLPDMATRLRDLFWGVVRVPAGVPRGDDEREELALPYPEPHRVRSSEEASKRLRRLAYNLV